MASQSFISEFCENSLKELEEGSVVFQDTAKTVRTVDDESVTPGDVVGKGAFANVKSAKVLRLSESTSSRKSSMKYAVKSLRSSLRSSLVMDGAIDLAKEAVFLSALKHPNIIYFHGAAKNPGRSDYFLIIEQLKFTLTDKKEMWLDEIECSRDIKTTRATKRETRECFLHSRMASILGLASALQYLHEKNILYRDLKPANIGFDKYDNIKLFDFGLATELKQANKVGDDQYKATECTGTPRYMANEVYHGQPYGHPADVFSFSVILYEVVCLERAFTYTSFDDHVKKVYRRKIRPKCNKTVPHEVKTWITKGWAHEPATRPKISTLFREMNEYLNAKGYCTPEPSP